MHIRLCDLPTSIKGICYHDDDGEEYVILNSRLPVEIQKEAYKHELKHINSGDMDNTDYKEYAE